MRTRHHFLSAILCSTLLCALPGSPLHAQSMFWESDPTYSSQNGALTALAARPGGGAIGTTFGSGLFRTMMHGGAWVPASQGFTDAGAHSLLVDADGIIYVGTRSKGVMKSLDSGASWQSANSGIEMLGVNAMAMGPGGTIYTATTQGLYASTDKAGTWSMFGPWNREVTDISINKLGIMAATVQNDRIYVSFNGGADWTPAPIPFLEDPLVFVAPNGTLYGGEDTLYSSTDQGASWAPVLAGGSVYTMIADNRGNMFVGTSTGVYVSTNGGYAWNEEGTGLSGHSVRTLAADSSGNVYAGTEAPMVFMRVSRPSSVERVTASASGTAINALGPNPSAGYGAITFTVAQPGRARLAISDALGREVALLAEGRYEPGSYRSEYDLSALPAGAYYCVLATDGGTATGSLILTR